MNEKYLQSSFEFGTQLMNNLDTLKKYQYRCIECNFETTASSDYRFNYIFNSSHTNKTIYFSYTPLNDTKKCSFTVSVESLNGKKLELNKLVKVDGFNTKDIFNCDSYTGDLTSKIQHFVENLNKIILNQFDKIINDS